LKLLVSFKQFTKTYRQLSDIPRQCNMMKTHRMLLIVSNVTNI